MVVSALDLLHYTKEESLFISNYILGIIKEGKLQDQPVKDYQIKSVYHIIYRLDLFSIWR